MFLIKRGHRTEERTLGLNMAEIVAAQVSRVHPQVIDIIEHWDDREDTEVASYFLGHRL